MHEVATEGGKAMTERRKRLSRKEFIAGMATAANP
jgi:hypothetical protein